MASKQQLLNFLNRHVFLPILNAKSSDYPATQKDTLVDVQKRTAAEKTRFHGYDTAERIMAMYKDDLSSEKAKTVNAHLQQLGLPRLVDVKDEFLKLAGEETAAS